jgi:hypothetical protein
VLTVIAVPVWLGEPPLGTAAVAYDAAGREVDDEVGELVLTCPLPSMPVAFDTCRDAVLDPDALAPFVDLARASTR